jgi:hypothetical protein
MVKRAHHLLYSNTDFLLVMVLLSYHSFLVHCPWLAIGLLLKSFSVKAKVIEGGFSLSLGDNIVILSMVKQSNPLLSNRLWACYRTVCS